MACVKAHVQRVTALIKKGGNVCPVHSDVPLALHQAALVALRDGVSVKKAYVYPIAGVSVRLLNTMK